MKLERLQTIAFDLKDLVFDNETEAIMYVTKDIYAEGFIIAIPEISFSCQIWDGEEERDLAWIKEYVPVNGLDRKEKLVKAIKAAITEFK